MISMKNRKDKALFETLMPSHYMLFCKRAYKKPPLTFILQGPILIFTEGLLAFYGIVFMGNSLLPHFSVFACKYTSAALTRNTVF